MTTALLVIAVAAFGLVSVRTYEPVRSRDRARALDELKRALSLLQAPDLEPAARVQAYRDGLARTEGRLRLAIRANPMDTTSIQRLAVVRWESSVLLGEPDIRSVLALIGIAAAHAPRVPELQADLGALLYRVGNKSQAAPFMRRAVELSPALTSRVVQTMEESGVDPQEMVALLPRTTETVIAVRNAFHRSDDLSSWLSVVEDLLPNAPASLILPYADACLAMDAPDRLLVHLSGLDVRAGRKNEAERQIAIGRAFVRKRDRESAAIAAREGVRLAAGDPGLLELVGMVALDAGEAELAVTSFRNALGALALSVGRASDRARLYRRRGEALERVGRVEEAIDDYRRAIEILPDDPWLQQRFASFGAGSRPQSGR